MQHFKNTEEFKRMSPEKRIIGTEAYQKMKANTVRFLNKIRGDYGVLEITNLHKVLGTVEDYMDIIEYDPYAELYFLGYLPSEELRAKLANGEDLPRAKDSYAIGTRYFRADFDIRKNTTGEDGSIISQEELYKWIHVLMDILKEDDLLATYNAVVCSGNGCHFYWIGGDTEMDAKTYANASCYYLDKISALLEQHDLGFLKPDYACSNICRLLRLPCSANYVYEYDKMKDIVNVDLILFEDSISPVISTFPEVGKEYVKKQQTMLKKEIAKAKKLEKNIIKFGLIPSWYEAANTKIDIRDLVCKYTGWTLASNGINFISQRDGGYTGAYAIPKENVVVHRGTPHFSDFFTVYSPFSFILVHYAKNDKKCAFDWIKENYSEINENGSKFYFNKKINYGNKK